MKLVLIKIKYVISNQFNLSSFKFKHPNKKFNVKNNTERVPYLFTVHKNKFKYMETKEINLKFARILIKLVM